MSVFRTSKDKVVPIPASVFNDGNSQSSRSNPNKKSNLFLLVFYSNEIIYFHGRVVINKVFKGKLKTFGYIFDHQNLVEAVELHSPFNSSAQFLTYDRNEETSKSTPNQSNSGLDMWLEKHVPAFAKLAIVVSPWKERDYQMPQMIEDLFQEPSDPKKKLKATEETEPKAQSPSSSVNMHYNIIPGFHILFNSSDIDTSVALLKEPQEWLDFSDNYLLEDFSRPVTSTPIPIVLVIGDKNSGKSSLAQFCVNNLLQNNKKVFYLDSDVGQPEFTPSGLISLRIIEKPYFGPAWTHLNPPGHVVRQYYVGDNSSKENPDFFSQCLMQLVNCYKTQELLSDQEKHLHYPIVINTHGWVAGVGLESVELLINEIKPNLILSLLSDMHKEPNEMLERYLAESNSQKNPQNADFVDESLEICRFTPVEVDQLPHITKHPNVVKRLLSFLSYFAKSFHSNPFEVDVKNVAVHFLTEQIAPSQCLFALNASLIGISSISSNLIQSKPSPQLKIQSNEEEEDTNTITISSNSGDPIQTAQPKNIPIVLNSCPIHPCLSIALLHSIDLDRDRISNFVDFVFEV